MAVGEFNHDKQAVSEKRTYSVQEIADILQISRSMAYNLCNSRFLKRSRLANMSESQNPPLMNGLTHTNKKENQYGIYRKAR